MDYCTHCRINLPHPSIIEHYDGEHTTVEYYCPHCGEPTASEQAKGHKGVLILSGLGLLTLAGLNLFLPPRTMYLLWGVAFISYLTVVKVVSGRLKSRSRRTESIPETPPASKTSNGTDKVNFKCACGHQFAASRSLAGREYRCPQCGRKDYAPPSLWD